MQTSGVAVQTVQFCRRFALPVWLQYRPAILQSRSQIRSRGPGCLKDTRKNRRGQSFDALLHNTVIDTVKMRYLGHMTPHPRPTDDRKECRMLSLWTMFIGHRRFCPGWTVGFVEYTVLYDNSAKDATTLFLCCFNEEHAVHHPQQKPEYVP